MSSKKDALDSLLASLSKKGLRYDFTLGHPQKIGEEFDEASDENKAIYVVYGKLEVMGLDSEGKLQTFRKVAAPGVSTDPAKAAEIAVNETVRLMPDIGFGLNKE